MAIKENDEYWLSTLPEDTLIDVLVDTANLRWRIERDYEELKSELGLAPSKGGAGEDSITKPCSALPPMES
jgi:SRSO17 transposase